MLHASTGVRFLGYDVRTYTPNRMRRIRREGVKPYLKRAATGKVDLRVPRDKVRMFGKSRGYGDTELLLSTHRPDMLNSTEVEIVTQYNSELRGFAQYYGLARGVKKSLRPLEFVEHGSLLATLANKHRSSRVKVVGQLKGTDGEWYATTFGQGGTIRRVKVWKLKHLELPDEHDGKLDEPAKYNLAWARTDMIDRLTAKECSNCGQTDVPIEVHHVRKLADHNKAKDFMLFIKAARTRKRIPLCQRCHRDLHDGRLPDFRTWMKEGVESRVR